MTHTRATDALIGEFRRGFDALGEDHNDDRRVVLTSWPAVPVEVVRAAGFEAITALGGTAATPAADALLEPGIFPSRLRILIEKAVTGQLDDIAAIVLPRTSDPDYKCFLYLREFVRRGVARSLPPVLLFDLLQSGSTRVPGYNAKRVRDLFANLTALSGRRSTVEALRREIALANAARAAARRLIALRRDEPRVRSREALPLLGTFWQLPASRYQALAESATAEIGGRSAEGKPRIVLAGVPVDSPAVHAAVDAAGGVVVAEVGPFGSGVAGDDVAADGDPWQALANKYRCDSVGPRTPVTMLSRWLESSLELADAVLLVLPAWDAVFGWDYPAESEFLDRRSMPHAVVEGDPGIGPTVADAGRIEALVSEAAEHKAARYG